MDLNNEKSKEEIIKNLELFQKLSDKLNIIINYPYRSIMFEKLRFTPDIISRTKRIIGTDEFVINADSKGNKTIIKLSDMTYPNGKYTATKAIKSLSDYVNKTHDINSLIILEKLKFMFGVCVLNLLNSREDLKKIMRMPLAAPALYRMVDDIEGNIKEFLKTEVGMQLASVAIRKNVINKLHQAREGRLGDWLSLVYLKSKESITIYNHFLELLNEDKISRQR